MVNNEGGSMSMSGTPHPPLVGGKDWEDETLSSNCFFAFLLWRHSDLPWHQCEYNLPSHDSHQNINTYSTEDIQYPQLNKPWSCNLEFKRLLAANGSKTNDSTLDVFTKRRVFREDYVYVYPLNKWAKAKNYPRYLLIDRWQEVMHGEPLTFTAFHLFDLDLTSVWVVWPHFFFPTFEHWNRMTARVCYI